MGLSLVEVPAQSSDTILAADGATDYIDAKVEHTATTPSHGRRLGGRLGGFVPPTPAKGPQFGTKSRRMVFLSAILLRLLRKISEISLRLRRKCKYERL